jgi:hypothetical protein
VTDEIVDALKFHSWSRVRTSAEAGR